MNRRITLFLIIFSLFALVKISAKDKFTLVIDAGHGGKDVGALGAFSNEKDINLNVALAFGRLVEDNLPDVKIALSLWRKDMSGLTKVSTQSLRKAI